MFKDMLATTTENKEIKDRLQTAFRLTANFLPEVIQEARRQ